jgi:hypothetical protein
LLAQPFIIVDTEEITVAIVENVTIVENVIVQEEIANVKVEMEIVA